MDRKLYNRLKRIRDSAPLKSEIGKRSAGRSVEPRSDRHADRHADLPLTGLDGWDAPAPHVYHRTVRRKLSFALPAQIASRQLGRPIPLDRLIFMDTETTGLSGGAGTVVFLVGAGVVQGDSLSVNQILLADYPGEAKFLELVAQHLGVGDVWVSYNGRAFDSKLLETRFVLNGKPPLAPEHLDLLYWSRRLWKRLIGPCGLSDIEANVIGTPRVGDISGAEIPDRFFSFLSTGDADSLADVFEHHLKDIVTLVALLRRIEETLSNPLAADFVDRYQLGRHLTLLGRPEGREVLRGLLFSPQRDEPIDVRERAGLVLGATLRREGDIDGALRICEYLHEIGSVHGAIELAKLLEHQYRNYARAITVVESALAADTGSFRALLDHRLERLVRKRSHLDQ